MTNKDHPIAIRGKEITRPRQQELSSQREDSLALPEVFVQLNCVNFLRQVGWREKYDYSHLALFQDSEKALLRRVDQCLEKLRKALMCWSDITPQLKMKGFFDGVTLHRCRNFDKISQWTEEHGIREVIVQR
jgi:hypothetical protein